MLAGTQRPMWELSNDIVGLETAIAEILEDEELTAEEKDQQTLQLFDRWLGTQAEFDTKAEALAGYIKYLDALAEARKIECSRLRELVRSAETQRDRIKGYLLSQMTKLNKTKVEGVTAKVSLRKKPPRVMLNGQPEDLPREFQKVTIDPMLTKIKEHLKANPDCDFAYMSWTEEYSLIIK